MTEIQKTTKITIFICWNCGHVLKLGESKINGHCSGYCINRDCIKEETKEKTERQRLGWGISVELSTTTNPQEDLWCLTAN